MLLCFACTCLCSPEEYFLFRLKLAKLYFKKPRKNIYFNTEAKSAEKIKLKMLAINVSIAKAQYDYNFEFAFIYMILSFLGYLFRFQNIYEDIIFLGKKIDNWQNLAWLSAS